MKGVRDEIYQEVRTKEFILSHKITLINSRDQGGTHALIGGARMLIMGRMVLLKVFYCTR
jgi:hypothetical protein